MEPNTVQEPGMNMTTPMIIGGAVIAALVIGGIVFWQDPARDEARTAQDVDAETWMPEASDSDEAAAIQAQLEATDMAAFESAMQADAEASASSI